MKDNAAFFEMVKSTSNAELTDVANEDLVDCITDKASDIHTY